MPDIRRHLYLVCYDIANPGRLARTYRFLLGYKIGGQKSFFECWLTKNELARVSEGLKERLDLAADRAHIFQLDPRQKPLLFGCAQRMPDTAFWIL